MRIEQREERPTASSISSAYLLSKNGAAAADAATAPRHGCMMDMTPWQDIESGLFSSVHGWSSRVYRECTSSAQQVNTRIKCYSQELVIFQFKRIHQLWRRACTLFEALHNVQVFATLLVDPTY